VNWNILPMMAAVVGGLGRLGPVLGALILIPICSSRHTLGAAPHRPPHRHIIYGAVIVLIAGWRPNGLLSLPWARWASRLSGRAPAAPVKG
jgi:ABC-type branched-subunit amino acid transport system permease subunit